ncbi:MAG TPA: hypothetical protein EYQ80_04190 [Candidatus Poseidoniales archaeon]|nr:hypothetical protein [Candidatus Poseidoniales archaeon]
MVAAATLHAFSTELLIGSMTFAVTATLLRLVATFSGLFTDNIRKGLDQAAFFASLFALAAIPLVILTGTFAADNRSISPIIVNKVLLSGLCLGLWVGVVHGRWTWGPELWSRKGTALFHSAITCAAYGVAAMLGSIGGLLTRGETVGDLLGFWPHFGYGLSITLALLSLVTLLIVIFIQPRGEPIEDGSGRIAESLDQ